jgi:hypothetical protein
VKHGRLAHGEGKSHMGETPMLLKKNQNVPLLFPRSKDIAGLLNCDQANFFDDQFHSPRVEENLTAEAQRPTRFVMRLSETNLEKYLNNSQLP